MLSIIPSFYLHGNVTKTDAIEMSQMVQEVLVHKPVGEETLIGNRGIILSSKGYDYVNQIQCPNPKVCIV